MSFDLYFRWKNPSAAEPFADFFLSRPNYEANESRTQFGYFNEDTGVYFSFFAGSDDDADEEGEPSDLALNVNYFRPSIFGAESVIELEALLDRFDLDINDPQSSGMGTGPFTREGYLHSWNKGNQFGYGAILATQGSDAELWTCPTDKLHQIWKWNYDLGVRREDYDEAFVPRILFVKGKPHVKTIGVWPGLCFVLLPELDYVLINRGVDEVYDLQGETELVLATWEQLSPFIQHYSRQDIDGMPCLYHDDIPEDDLISFVAGLEAFEKQDLVIPTDRVLDAETLEAALARRG